MEMITSAKCSTTQEDDMDDEEEFVLKKEPSTPVANTTTTSHMGIVTYTSLCFSKFLCFLLYLEP